MTTNAPTHTPLDEAAFDALERELVSHAVRIQRETYRLLCCIRELDERGNLMWRGFRSCAHYLNWRIGLDMGAAREKVRVARALAGLPKTSAALAEGRVSYAKVRALTRIAHPGNEADLLNIAENATCSQLETLVRRYRRATVGDRELARRQAEGRYLTYHYDQDGMLELQGRLPPEVGAALVAALERAMADLRPERGAQAPGGGAPGRGPARDVSTETRADSLEQRRADALGDVARAALAHEGGAKPGAEVVVHVDAHVLTREASEGRCEIEGPGGVSVETARRIACDATIVPMLDGENDAPSALGRRRRAVSPGLRRVLRERDQGCRFPGCGARRFVHAHHVRHWADGGETRLGNLVELCGLHHRLLHEGGWELRAGAGGALTFVGPRGELPAAPALGCDMVVNLPDELRAEMPCWGGDRMDYAYVLDGLLAARAGGGGG